MDRMIFVNKDEIRIACFILEEEVVTVAQGGTPNCCAHGPIKTEHIAPDLVSIFTYIAISTPKVLGNSCLWECEQLCHTWSM